MQSVYTGAPRKVFSEYICTVISQEIVKNSDFLGSLEIVPREIILIYLEVCVVGFLFFSHISWSS